jgi:hypothetical protein
VACSGWCLGRHGRSLSVGSVVAALVAASALPAPGVVPAARAQSNPRRAVVVPPLVATAVHDLAFGNVLPGIPVSVSSGDPNHSGLFEISGPAAACVRVEFTLPSGLTGGGAPLPLVFGPADGFDFSHLHPHGVFFDPHVPLVGVLGADGQLFVRLGGTVLPTRTQPGGAYSATITMTVYNLGS